ncbi:ParA family protein [Piscinibacter sp. XHJ-5]|uniref:ParA family protein n=1 Tax=Piscinibacter sp. XHJ-5 TaxID=3037797 RepID=UPI0024530B35|nr:ParA family protein [Piscinibacter sp. XHJ-5]
MPVIVVANPKGGVGKSTLATQVAGYFASKGHAVMLGDVDRQQSSRMWLKLRPAGVPAIQAWEVSQDDIVRPPKGTTHVVLDTPAGLHDKRLEAVMRHADKVLVPLQPSIFDIHATHDFLREILARKKHGGVQVGIVGMRFKEGTISADQLRHFLGTLDVPVIGYLRDTQNYVHLAARGLTLWDVAPSRVQRDLEQWQSIGEWLDR